MNRLRITFVLPYADLSGGIQAAVRQAVGLFQRGHLVRVVSTPMAKPTARDRLRALVRQRKWLAAPRQGPSALDGTGLDWRILDRFRPVTDKDIPDGDVVVATWWATVAGVASLSPAKGVPVHFVQGHEVSEVFPGIPDHLATQVWRYRMGRVAVSQWLANLARDRYHCPSVLLAPNGVDLAKYASPPRNPPDRPTVGWVCSPLRVKGADLAVQALEMVRRRHPGVRVISFGGLPDFDGLRLPEWVEFTPSPPQQIIPSLYASCTVWLFPSRQEGFGLPILEAMAARTPVVAMPAGAAPEILTAGGGTLVPAEDQTAMADAVDRILSMSPTDWQGLSNTAFAVAQARTWPAATARFEACLRLCLDGECVEAATDSDR